MTGFLEFEFSHAPGVARRAWTRWRRTARVIGDFQARLLVTILYFVVIAPSLALKWRSDPLAIKAHAARLAPASDSGRQRPGPGNRAVLESKTRVLILGISCYFHDGCQRLRPAVC